MWLTAYNANNRVVDWFPTGSSSFGTFAPKQCQGQITFADRIR